MLKRFVFLDKATVKDKIAFLIATGLGSGLSPKAPGTVGSFCALLPIWGGVQFGVWGIVVLSIFFYLSGWYATYRILKIQKNQDPGFVVIDEFAGQSITFLFVSCFVMPWYYYLIGFMLFRFFDIVKVWPASYFDKRVHSAFGVMTDDIMAGIYAGLILLGFHFIMV